MGWAEAICEPAHKQRLQAGSETTTSGVLVYLHLSLLPICIEECAIAGATGRLRVCVCVCVPVLVIYGVCSSRDDTVALRLLSFLERARGDGKGGARGEAQLGKKCCLNDQHW